MCRRLRDMSASREDSAMTMLRLCEAWPHFCDVPLVEWSPPKPDIKQNVKIKAKRYGRHVRHVQGGQIYTWHAATLRSNTPCWSCPRNHIPSSFNLLHLCHGLGWGQHPHASLRAVASINTYQHFGDLQVCWVCCWATALHLQSNLSVISAISAKQWHYYDEMKS